MLIVITALTDTSGDDESDTVLELAAVATDEVVCVRVGGTNVGCYRLEGPGTYDLLPDDLRLRLDGRGLHTANTIATDGAAVVHPRIRHGSESHRPTKGGANCA